MTQVIDLAWVSTTRPAEWPEAVSIAEIAVFTPCESVDDVATAVGAEFAWEMESAEPGLIRFKDGSSLEWKVNA